MAQTAPEHEEAASEMCITELMCCGIGRSLLV